MLPECGGHLNGPCSVCTNWHGQRVASTVALTGLDIAIVGQLLGYHFYAIYQVVTDLSFSHL